MLIIQRKARGPHSISRPRAFLCIHSICLCAVLSSLRALLKRDREVLDSKHNIAACLFQLNARYALDIIEALKEHSKRNLGFQPRQWRPEAKVNAMSKR